MCSTRWLSFARGTGASCDITKGGEQERRAKHGLFPFQKKNETNLDRIFRRIQHFKDSFLCDAVHGRRSYLRASTRASESASRIPFLMLSTRTAVCLPQRRGRRHVSLRQGEGAEHKINLNTMAVSPLQRVCLPLLQQQVQEVVAAPASGEGINGRL